MAGNVLLSKGRYRARLAQTQKDIRAAQALRTLAFRTESTDRDQYDDLCTHVLVEDSKAGGQLACCFRMLTMQGGSEIGNSYSAQFYDLSALAGFDGQMGEMGRFCIHPDWTDPDMEGTNH